MSRTTVRAATVHDFDARLTLWHGYPEFYKADTDHETTMVTRRRLLNAAEPMYAALADLGGKTVGFVRFIEHRSCWTVGHDMYLQDLFADATVRGRGAGRARTEHGDAQSGAGRILACVVADARDQCAGDGVVDPVADRSGRVRFRQRL